MAADTSGTILGELINATSRRVSWALDDGGTASINLNCLDAQANLIHETTGDLMVYRYGVLMWRGRWCSSTGNLDANSFNTTFAAKDYRKMLVDHRMVAQGGLTFTNQLPHDIAWALIQNTQGQTGGNWGITRGPTVNTPTTHVYSKPYAAGTSIGSSIDDLSHLDLGGFDWEIDAGMHFNVWCTPGQSWIPPSATPYPLNLQGRGRNTGYDLVWADNVVAITRNIDVSKYANVIHISGSNTAGNITTEIDVTDMYTGSFGTAGRWEAQDGNTDIPDLNFLSQYATGSLQRSALLIPSYQMVMRRGVWTPSLLWLGDLVNVRVRSGRLNEQYQARVSQIDVAVDDTSGAETVTVTVGPVPANISGRITNLKKVVNNTTNNVTQVSGTTPGGGGGGTGVVSSIPWDYPGAIAASTSPAIVPHANMTIMGFSCHLSTPGTTNTVVNLLVNGSIVATVTLAATTGFYNYTTISPVTLTARTDNYSIQIATPGNTAMDLGGEIELS